MARRRNLCHFVAFDPGGTIGWAHLILERRAFCDPSEKCLANLLWAGTGEYEGTEHEQIRAALERVRTAKYGKMPFSSWTDVTTEDFDLVQTIGGRQLLSPVRINAVLEWEVLRQFAIHINYQARQLRTGVTKERLKLWKLPYKGKDSFAAMQHAVTRMRRVKLEANQRPWKLVEPA